MFAFVIKRLISGFLLLLVMLLFSIWMIRLIPGSYSEIMKAEDIQQDEHAQVNTAILPVFYFSIIPEKKAAQDIRSILPVFRWNGFQNEFHQQLKSYVSFDFGKSVIDGVAVKNKFLKAFPWTLILQIPAVFFIILLSIWIALRRILIPDSMIMKAIDYGLIGLHSIPGFWLATVLLLLFANPDAWHVFPSGLQAVSSYNPFTVWIFYPQYLILPLLCLILPALAYLVRLIKNGLESSLQKLFWKRALSSGLSFRDALYKEALPIALIPMIAWCAGILPAFISGSLIVEQIFSIPGLGRLMYFSISMRDWPVVQFLFLLGSAMTILGFMMSDILLRYFDPRIQDE